ncbi:MAG: LPXTG cell wall anchor domain-containing protein [Lachnospiraceae bacterium]|nr:LPXTG cell wall anchor domain-containing protein [Lachnospiraceae bacterium]
MKFEKLKTALPAFVLAAAVGASSCAGAVPALAGAARPGEFSVLADAGSSVNNTAAADALENSDIIDTSKTGLLTIRKYDLTAAEAAGAYSAGLYGATGEADSDVEDALEGYGIEGVQFTLLRVGNIEQYSTTGGGTAEVCLVYEIPPELAEILADGGLDPAEAVDMDTDWVSERCSDTDMYHFTSDAIESALAAILADDNVQAKNRLEMYLCDYGTLVDNTDDMVTGSDVNGVGTAINMPLTDEEGYTAVTGLPLGLYLAVETQVSEQAAETVNPFFVQLPFTAASEQDSEYWLYDMTVYPKNQSGNPSLDKSVRNAYSNTAEDDKNGAVNAGGTYDGANDSDSLVVWNDDSDSVLSVTYDEDGNIVDTATGEQDTDDANYVSNRGGYTIDGTTSDANGAGTSVDYAYRDTTTASGGDLLDYILVSRLPHISSAATYLTEYTFADYLSAALVYSGDVRIAFYHTGKDAAVNNTAQADLIWYVTSDSSDAKYAEVTETNPYTGTETYEGTTELTVSLTEEGLALINGTDAGGSPVYWTDSEGTQWQGFSDYYMVVYYTVNVASDDTAVLGDAGNENNVSLTWSRSSEGYYNVLTDRNYVYTYGLDLTKQFSDGNGSYKNVQFRLYNSTDYYYVTAEEAVDSGGSGTGVYYVTGKTTDEAKAAAFVPSDTGHIVINGLEADTYALTEVATDGGYSLLGDRVVISILQTDREIIASVSGVTGLTSEDAAAIIEFYNGGIYDENGNLISAAETDLAGDAVYDKNGNLIRAAVQDASVDYSAPDSPNGRTINGSDMYVGDIVSAAASVDGAAGAMTASGASENAFVGITVTNTKNFLLPQTGGTGLYLITVAGVAAAAGGIYMAVRRKRKKVRV